MQKCWYSKVNKEKVIVQLVLLGIMTVLFFIQGIGFLIADNEEGNLFFAVTCILAASFSGTSALIETGICTREFQLVETGIVLRYLKRYKVFIPWEKVHNVVLCDVFGPVNGMRSFVLRVALMEEKKGPMSKSIRWRTIQYSRKYYKKVINIEYSKDRYEIMKLYYPGEIIKSFSAQAKLDKLRW